MRERKQNLAIAAKTDIRSEWIVVHDGWCLASKVEQHVEWMKTADSFLDVNGLLIDEPATVIGVFGTFPTHPVLVWER
jgi:hypothetical protein